MTLSRTLIAAARSGVGVAWAGGLMTPVGPAAAARMVGAGLRHGVAASALLGMSAARWPDRPFVVDDDGTASFAEVCDRSGCLAGALRHRGIGRGSRVGVLCRNHAGFVVASFAATWADADLVLLNTDFGATQLGDVARRQGLDALVHDAELGDVVAASGFVGLVVVAGRSGEGAMATLEGEGRTPPRGGGRHGRIVILTSGTTGTPKGSRRDPDALTVIGAIAPVSSLVRAINLRSGDPVMILPPLFHGFGLAYLLMALSFGCPVVLTRRFDPASVLAGIERHRVRVVLAVPVMLSRLLDLPDDVRASADTTSLRAVQSGAAALSPQLAIRFMDAFGDVLHDVYGSTETGWSTIAGPADLRNAQGSVGLPLRGVSVRILDDDDQHVPAGAVGGIFIDSGMTAPHYTGGGAKRIVDGHVSTGDLGHLDAAGRLFIDGREDDMIVSGGENVFPGEVQDVVSAHPGVREATAHGADDEEFGQRLVAVVVLDDDVDVSADEIKAFVRDRLSRHKVPRDIEFVETLDRTATGKVRRVR